MSRIYKFLIKAFNRKVGQDQYGNEYYLGSTENYLGKSKRYVIYNGMDESTKVPPIWHGWLHYLSDDIPKTGKDKKYLWQKDYLPNLTGTKSAYNPADSKNVTHKTYSSWMPK